MFVEYPRVSCVACTHSSLISPWCRCRCRAEFSTHPTAPGNPWQIPTDTPAGTAVVDIERPQGLLVMMELIAALANGLADPDKREPMSKRASGQPKTEKKRFSGQE